MQILEILKNSLNDANGKVSHKRILVYASWLVLLAAYISNTYFKCVISDAILYVFAGLAGGGMAASVMEKKSLKPETAD